MFLSLSNEVLVRVYIDSVKFKLDKDFVILLEEEITRRGIIIENFLM